MPKTFVKLLAALVTVVSAAVTSPAAEKVIFLGAHPDDSEGYAGTAFLLATNYKIHMVDLTRGELGLGQKGLDDASTAYRRTQEEAAASAYLGATVHYIGEVDGFACASDRAANKLADLLRELKPKAVFTHWPVDRHADHMQCAALLARAMVKTGLLPEIYYYEVLLSQTCNWHPIYSVDISTTMTNKVQMLRNYACQNVNDSLVRAKERQARLRGSSRSPTVAYAETFTTFDGNPTKGGVLESLKETARVDKGESGPVKVIFDTDMYTDFDDAGALACLHALADAGECEILATIANTRDCMSVAMCEIINAYYGRPDLPVGCVKGIGLGNEQAEAHDRRYGATVRKYAKWVRHLNSDDAPDAAEVYRKILSAQPDKSVVICTVGFLTNMRKLMESDRELVARKVKLWVAMACAYPKGKECNSMTDAESSRIAFERWPTPIVFSDFQYGMDCFAGRALEESEVKDSPVADVFRGNMPSRVAIARDAGGHLRGCNGLAGRAAWDETAVLAAVRGVESYFNVHRGTYRMVGADGENEWIPDEKNGPHLRLTEKVNKIEIGKVIDGLMCHRPHRKMK